MNNKDFYYIEGMHCASCELLIEKRLKKCVLIDHVSVSSSKARVDIVYKEEKKLSHEEINTLFQDLGYKFVKSKVDTKKARSRVLKQSVVLFVLVLLGFTLLQKTNIGATVSLNASSSLLAFFVFGLVAGISSCAALVGGLLLSLTKKWNEMYAGESANVRARPFILFNMGRLIAYAVLGGGLGLVGSVFKLSVSFTAALTIFVSFIMIVLGLQMLGVKWASKFQLKMPKKFTGYASEEGNFKTRFMPFIVGALTFFMPCGFTLVAQGVALTSGSFVKGSLSMLFFALGTLPMLSAISFTSVKLNSKPILTAKFNYVAGMFVVFFGLYNFNSQLNVLGLKSLSDIKFGAPTEQARAAVTDTFGTQLMQIEAKGFAYYPTSFTLKSGVSTRLEVINSGAVGCANAMIGRNLFSGVMYLTRGLNVAEFTAPAPGYYKITCSMGMVPPVSVRVI